MPRPSCSDGHGTAGVNIRRRLFQAPLRRTAVVLAHKSLSWLLSPCFLCSFQQTIRLPVPSVGYET